MGLHERAWAGLGLLIYGKNPMVPMQIEQAMSEATPNNEVKIDSFEDYGDALDFCKSKRNIGFVVLLENCGDLPVHDVFKQLSLPYEAKGWPCFGVLVHSGSESLTGLRTLQRCPNLLGYFSTNDFLEKDKTAQTLIEIWTRFLNAFEKNIIPPALQETFTALASLKVPTDSFRFQDRLSCLLSSNLNLSWIETVAIRWAPIIDAIKATHPTALKPHDTLVQICNLANYPDSTKTLASILESKETSLCSRVSRVTTLLDISRRNGSLTETLKSIGTQTKPGSPALLRHLVAARDRILDIAAQEEQTVKLESTG